MVLSSKTLALMGAYYTFAFKSHCTPFQWDWKTKLMSKTDSSTSLFMWISCSVLMWTKIIFMTIRLYQSYKYLDVTVDEFCIHYYYWVLYTYAGFLQVNGYDMRNTFPRMVNQYTGFNSSSKKKYFPHITTPGILQRDNIEPEVMNVFAIVFINASVTFYLFMDNPHSPQFFYSVLSPGGVASSSLMLFAFLEAYLTLFSWTTILLWATTSICCSSTLNFWLKQMNSGYASQHVSRPDSSIHKLDERMKLYRALQVLLMEYNSVAFRMTVGVKAAAFWSHLGTNYGTLRLYHSMKFQIWVNCPLVSVCGLAVLLQLFKLLSWVNVEANHLLGDMKKRLHLVPMKGRYNRCLANKLLKSLRPLKIKGHHFYYFKQSTPVTFYKQLSDYTINVLLTF